MIKEKIMEQRYFHIENIQTRSDEDTKDLILEGYFSVFNSIYPVWDGVTESIAPGAFTESINDDVRALFNHNTDLILGRTTNGTLELRQDDHGLWGRIKINPNDSDAVNAYERVARGDVTGCSFGFDIESETRTVSDDGSVHYTINKVSPLYEVSPCVFPAYEATRIDSRHLNEENIKKREREEWKVRMMSKLKGE